MLLLWRMGIGCGNDCPPSTLRPGPFPGAVPAVSVNMSLDRPRYEIRIWNDETDYLWHWKILLDGTLQETDDAFFDEFEALRCLFERLREAGGV
jgi:hypothetical protein